MRRTIGLLLGLAFVAVSASFGGYRLGFGAGKLYEFEDSWVKTKGRLERLGYYLGGDLRGWDIRSVEFVYDLERGIEKELFVLTKEKPLVHSWSLRMGIKKETKEPFILVIVSNGESFLDGVILIDEISLTELNKKLDEKWRQGAALGAEIQKEIQNLAPKIAHKIMGKS